MSSVSQNNNVAITKTRCGRCNGSGFVTVEPIRCDTCTRLNIKGCSRCKGGYVRFGFDDCPDCHGAGEFVSRYPKEE